MSTLFKSLKAIYARCRTDVVALKKPGQAPVWTSQKLTSKALNHHLNGGPYVGLAPIQAGTSSTLVAVLDLDSHKGETPWPEMVTAALGICELLYLLGYEPIVFRSSGGHGIHIYLLWDEPQDAYSVREFLRGVLDGCGLRNGTGGIVAGQAEIFPKQDSVPLDGHGNMFVLPLAGASEPLEWLADLAPMGKEWAAEMPWPVSPPVTRLEKPARELRTGVLGDAPELATLRAALAAIPNEGDAERDYDTWRNIVFALHHATDGGDEGLAMAHEFSSRSGKYDPDFLDERVWPYIRQRENAITERTLLAMAREHGWVDDAMGDFEVVDTEPLEADGEEIASTRPDFRGWYAEATSENEWNLVAQRIRGNGGALGAELDVLVKIAQKRFKEITGYSVRAESVRPLLLPARARIQNQGAGGADMEDWCEPYAWCQAEDCYIHRETQEKLTVQSFNATHDRDVKGRWMTPEGFQMSAHQVALKEIQIPIVARRMYLPWAGQQFEQDGLNYLNSYRPGLGATPIGSGEWNDEQRSAIARFKAHVVKLCGEESGAYLLEWMAYCVQNPGRKIRHSILIKGTEGDGKSLFGTVMELILGAPNVGKVSPAVLKKDFNAWAAGHCVALIEELRVQGHNRYDIMNAIKECHTNDRITVHPKGKDSYEMWNTQNYMAFTNFADAIPLTLADRRYYVIFSPYTDEIDLARAGLDGDYFDALFDAIRANVGALAGWLMEMPIRALNPNGRAPFTEDKALMAGSAGHDEDSSVQEIINQGLPGISREVISTSHLSAALLAASMEDDDIEVPIKKAMGATLKRLGYTKKDGKIVWQGKECRIWVRDKRDANNRATLIKLLDLTLISDLI